MKEGFFSNKIETGEVKPSCKLYIKCWTEDNLIDYWKLIHFTRKNGKIKILFEERDSLYYPILLFGEAGLGGIFLSCLTKLQIVMAALLFIAMGALFFFMWLFRWHFKYDELGELK